MRGDAGAARTLQAVGIGPVADHRGDFDRQLAAELSVQQRLEIAAAAGNQHYHRHGREYRTVHVLMTRDCSSAAATTSRTRQARSPPASSWASAASACSASTQSTMPNPQLKVRYISCGSMPLASRSQSNTAGCFQFAVSTLAPRPLGSTRGRFSNRPPPVMWLSALTGTDRISSRTGLT